MCLIKHHINGLCIWTCLWIELFYSFIETDDPSENFVMRETLFEDLIMESLSYITPREKTKQPPPPKRKKEQKTNYNSILISIL